MSIKKQSRKGQQKRKTKTRRAAKRRAQKMWHPTNYLLESNVKLGIPECEEDTRSFASPV